MSRDIAAEAHHDADKFSHSFRDHDQRALGNLMDDVNQEKNRLTPAQYKEYLADLNRDLKVPLNGLTITDVEGSGGRMALTFDGNGNCYRFGANDQRRFEDASQRTTGADGAVSERYGDGTYVRRTRNSDGSTTSRYVGHEDPKDDYSVDVKRNGDYIVHGSNGRTMSSHLTTDGREIIDSHGPRAQDNYHKELDRSQTYRLPGGNWKIQ